MSSIAVYRGYTHEANEVNLVSVDYRTQYSPRNKKLVEVRRMNLVGELNYDTPSALATAAANVVAAYSQDGGDFTYTVGGVVAHHLRNTSDCISGVKVVNKSFPTGDPAELCTTRTFAVTLEATYDVCEDNIVSWRESVEVTGTGGPLFVVTETLLGPIIDLLAYSTAMYYTQSGQAVGFRDYPVPPPPLQPNGEFGHRRRIKNTTGIQQGTGIRYYTTSWAYYLASAPGSPYGNAGTSV